MKRAERDSALRCEKSVAATRALAALGSRCGLHSLLGDAAVELRGDDSSSSLVFSNFSSMSFQRRALSTAASPALRARLLNLPATCRTLSIGSVQSLGRLARPINKRTDQTTLYSTADSASILENFKKSCKTYNCIH